MVCGPMKLLIKSFTAAQVSRGNNKVSHCNYTSSDWYANSGFGEGMKSWLTDRKWIEIHVLGHLTPRASLGLESSPYLAPEWCQQGHSGWMWVCVSPPALPGSSPGKQLHSAGPISIGVGKVQSRMVSQGIQDCNHCPQEFGTIMGAEMPWGWEETWAVPKTQTESRSWDTAGGMFSLGFSVTAGFTFQRRDIAPDPPVFQQAIYQIKMNLCGQNKINCMKTHVGISQFERFPFSLKLFRISFPQISFPLVYTLGWRWKEWRQRNLTKPL